MVANPSHTLPIAAPHTKNAPRLRSIAIRRRAEYGLAYDVHAKKLDDAAKSGGLHSGPPGFEFVRFPSTYQSVDLSEDTCVSEDGLRVTFSVTFQYQLPYDWLVPVVIKYNSFPTWERIVIAAGKSAVQHSCSLFSISNFQNKRGIIQTTMEENLRLKLEGADGSGSSGVYARAISLQLRDVELPSEYRESVSEKQSAAEDITLAQNQRSQETTKASTLLLAAREEAKKINNTAVTEAAVILTEANLRAQEIAFAFAAEAQVYAQVKADLNLTDEGLLAYVANRMYEGATGPVKVAAAEPAKLSWKDEL